MNVAEAINTYIDFKRVLGMSFRTDAGVLGAFARTIGDVDLREVKPPAVRAFIAGKGPVTAFWHCKYTVLGSFYRFAISRRPVSMILSTPACHDADIHSAASATSGSMMVTSVMTPAPCGSSGPTADR